MASRSLTSRLGSVGGRASRGCARTARSASSSSGPLTSTMGAGRAASQATCGIFARLRGARRPGCHSPTNLLRRRPHGRGHRPLGPHADAARPPRTTSTSPSWSVRTGCDAVPRAGSGAAARSDARSRCPRRPRSPRTRHRRPRRTPGSGRSEPWCATLTTSTRGSGPAASSASCASSPRSPVRSREAPPPVTWQRDARRVAGLDRAERVRRPQHLEPQPLRAGRRRRGAPARPSRPPARSRPAASRRRRGRSGRRTRSPTRSATERRRPDVVGVPVREHQQVDAADAEPGEAARRSARSSRPVSTTRVVAAAAVQHEPVALADVAAGELPVAAACARPAPPLRRRARRPGEEHERRDARRRSARVRGRGFARRATTTSSSSADREQAAGRARRPRHGRRRGAEPGHGRDPGRGEPREHRQAPAEQGRDGPSRHASSPSTVAIGAAGSARRFASTPASGTAGCSSTRTGSQASCAAIGTASASASRGGSRRPSRLRDGPREQQQAARGRGR